MIRGLPASIIAHAAVLGASYVTFPYWSSNTRVFSTELEVVDVEFAEIGEITNIAPLIETEPEEPEEAAPEEPEEEIPEEPVEEELPEAEQDVSEADAAPPEEAPEDVLPDFTPEEPEEEPETTPEPEKEPEPAPRRPQDDLMDFLNQSETTFKSERATRRERPEPQVTPPEQPQTALKDAPKPAETRNRRGAGERNANTARLEALISSRIRNECWQGVDDLPNPEKYNVQMKVMLNQNGTVADLTVVDPKGRQTSYMGQAVERAKRAVGRCSPFRLPDDDYELWKEINVYLGLGYAESR